MVQHQQITIILVLIKRDFPRKHHLENLHLLLYVLPCSYLHLIIIVQLIVINIKALIEFLMVNRNTKARFQPSNKKIKRLTKDPTC